MTIHEPSRKLWDADVRQVAEEIDRLFPRTQWTSTYPGHGDDGAAYAIDFMCDRADGDKISKYVWANRKRLGVWYVIWWGKIISMTRPASGWLRYFAASDPNPSKSHKNHVHVSVYKTLKYVPPGGDVKPRPVVFKGNIKSTIYLDLLKPGTKDSQSVFVVQSALVKVLTKANLEVGITPSGDFGDATLKAAKRFQKLVDDDVIDGKLGPYDVAELLKRAGYKNSVEAKS